LCALQPCCSWRCSSGIKSQCQCHMACLGYSVLHAPAFTTPCVLTCHRPGDNSPKQPAAHSCGVVELQPLLHPLMLCLCCRRLAQQQRKDQGGGWGRGPECKHHCNTQAWAMCTTHLNFQQLAAGSLASCNARAPLPAGVTGSQPQAACQNLPDLTSRCLQHLQSSARQTCWLTSGSGGRAGTGAASWPRTTV